jgi:methylated-DNA-[protein]-cysteine S-methyltransferase
VLDFEDAEARFAQTCATKLGGVPSDADAPPEWLRSALDLYFGGHDVRVDASALDERGTAFERAVWAALRDIPRGATRAYADIAAAVGRPGAARAVGGANARNPIALLTPCHRVIGRSGALVGYGGGAWRKAWLLAHEGGQRSP